MSRAAVYQLLGVDLAMNGYGINPNTVFQSNTVDDPPTRPFVIMRWGIKTSTFDIHGPQSLDIWAHDDRGDYSRIDSILHRAEVLLLNAAHLVGDDGYTLTSAEFVSCSEDLYDDGYQTITRYATFRVVSRVS